MHMLSRSVLVAALILYRDTVPSLETIFGGIHQPIDGYSHPWLQARSQKFAMGGGCLGGLGAEPFAGGWGFGGFAFFCKNKFCIFLQK